MPHIPVLLHEAIEGLSIQPNDLVLDGTLGSGGHSEAILSKLTGSGKLIALDLDWDAITRSKERLRKYGSQISFFNKNFRNLDEVLKEAGISFLNKILLDLGFSSDQLENSGRGFSFQRDEPLLMTLRKEVKEDTLTAKEIVNTWEENNLADIIFHYGEEKFARRIAKGIVSWREQEPIESTKDLVFAIERSVPSWYRRGKIHCATKTFQALRITVNDELGALKEGLTKSIGALSSKGRLAIISFHSLEDRIVKNFFRSEAHLGTIRILTKKPIISSLTERKDNPRARSAKLRIIEKI